MHRVGILPIAIISPTDYSWHWNIEDLLLIIEFIGTPGAGKTALRHELILALRASGYKAKSDRALAQSFAAQTPLGWLVRKFAPTAYQDAFLWRLYMLDNWIARILFMVEHPGLVWNVIRYQHTRPTEAQGRERRAAGRFFHLTGSYRLLSPFAQNSTALVYDEGFVQRAVLLFASDVETFEFERINQYLWSIPTPDLIVHPRVALDICIQRVIDRGIWGPFKNKSVPEINRFLKNANQVIEHAESIMKERGVPVIEFENAHEDLKEVTQNIGDAILETRELEPTAGQTTTQ